MDPIRLIEIHKSEFTKVEEKIREYIVDNLGMISSYPIGDIAMKCKVSKSALLRFCQKCGYRGYAEFKYEVSRYLQGLTNTVSADQISNPLIDIYKDAIGDLDQYINEFKLSDIVEIIQNAHKIKIYGVHETGLSAKYFSYRLANFGIDSEAITEPNIFPEKSNLSTEKDLNIFLSLSMETNVIKEAIETSLNHDCHTVIMTQNSHHKFTGRVKNTILLPTFHIDRNKYFVDAQPLLFIAIDVVLNKLVSQL